MFLVLTGTFCTVPFFDGIVVFLKAGEPMLVVMFFNVRVPVADFLVNRIFDNIGGGKLDAGAVDGIEDDLFVFALVEGDHNQNVGGAVEQFAAYCHPLLIGGLLHLILEIAVTAKNQ